MIFLNGCVNTLYINKTINNFFLFIQERLFWKMANLKNNNNYRSFKGDEIMPDGHVLKCEKIPLYWFLE